jgi:integrase
MSTDAILVAINPDHLPALRQLGIIDQTHTAPTLNDHPRTWTLPEFHEYLLARHAPSTAQKRHNTIRYLLNHPQHPVELHPPNEASYLNHVAQRTAQNTLNAPAKIAYRKALLDLLRFLRLDSWPSLDKPPKHAQQPVEIPPDHIVPRYWNEFPYPFPRARATLEHVCHFGFKAGPRPPTEIINMRIDDIEWDSRSVVLITDKKGKKRRVIESLPAEVITSKTTKSLWHYFYKTRPRSNSDAFWVTSSGTPLTKAMLGVRLNRDGKQLWSRWRAYSMRHWYVTKTLMETNCNLYLTSQITDASIKVLMNHYIDHPRVRKWIRAHPETAQLPLSAKS